MQNEKKIQSEKDACFTANWFVLSMFFTKVFLTNYVNLVKNCESYLRAFDHICISPGISTA